MRTLIPTECETWVDATLVSAFGDRELLFETIRDSHVQAQLARFLVDWLGEFESALFWLTHWPFYQPDEMALIMGLRRSHGDSGNLIESPGHAFPFAERAELTGWVSLVLRFGWDAELLIRPFRGDVFNTSHHGTVQVRSASSERLHAVRDAVRFFGLPIVRETPAA